MSDLISREDVLRELDGWFYDPQADEITDTGMHGTIRALPAVQPDAAAIREAALREVIHIIDQALLSLWNHERGDLWTLNALKKAVQDLFDNPGKEVMPDETNDPRHTQSDTAPAGLSAGGGAEPTVQQAAQVLLAWYDDLRDPMAVGPAIAQSEEAYLKAMKVAGHKEAASSARARRFLESIARGNAKLIRSLTPPATEGGA